VTRVLRLPDGTAVRLTGPRPMLPFGDHLPVTVTPLDGGAEADVLLHESWTAIRDRELGAHVARRLELEAGARLYRRPADPVEHHDM
jgi:hypothetical protein